MSCSNQQHHHCWWGDLHIFRIFGFKHIIVFVLFPLDLLSVCVTSSTGNNRWPSVRSSRTTISHHRDIGSKGRFPVMSSALKLRAIPAAGGLVSRGSRTLLQRQAFRSSIQRQIVQSPFKRAYASGASPVVKPPKSKLRYFKYAWRGTYTLAIAGTVWLAYSIYETRFPKEQIEPDPTKKTLVILGKIFLPPEKLFYYL